MANERKRKRVSKMEQKPKRQPAQDVVYTPPEPLNRKKLILRLLTVVAVVAALFLGFSIFFRVENIVISGMEKYTYEAVREASGIEDGESLLSFGKAKAAGRITEALPYVKTVRIGITLPDTVNIYIEELDVVYSAQDQNENWWLLTSDGRIVEKTTQSKAEQNTQLIGFQLLEPVVGEQAKAVEEEPDQTDETGEEIIIAFTNQERLSAALTIADQLERNEILGTAASIDVTDMGNIVMWYGSRYQVLLGDEGMLEEKIATMKAAIREMDSHESGVLDLTFTTEPNKVIYTPFT